MLMNAKGEKPGEIIISKKQWKELMIITNDGIKKEASVCKEIS
jgi:hypothetical protein